jgi:hypothetical protein
VRVGLLDIDLTGPSLPRMLGLDSRAVHQSSSGWVPVYADQERRLGCMSIGFLLQDRGDSVVWRGPKKDGMIRQFLAEVRWGDLDYLVIDTPPGELDGNKREMHIAPELKSIWSGAVPANRYIGRTHLPPHTFTSVIPPVAFSTSKSLLSYPDVHPHLDTSSNSAE